jgi:hypothetical protein
MRMPNDVPMPRHSLCRAGIVGAGSRPQYRTWVRPSVQFGGDVAGSIVGLNPDFSHTTNFSFSGPYATMRIANRLQINLIPSMEKFSYRLAIFLQRGSYRLME